MSLEVNSHMRLFKEESHVSHSLSIQGIATPHIHECISIYTQTHTNTHRDTHIHTDTHTYFCNKNVMVVKQRC